MEIFDLIHQNQQQSCTASLENLFELWRFWFDPACFVKTMAFFYYLQHKMWKGSLSRLILLIGRESGIGQFTLLSSALESFFPLTVPASRWSTSSPRRRELPEWKLEERNCCEVLNRKHRLELKLTNVGQNSLLPIIFGWTTTTMIIRNEKLVLGFKKCQKKFCKQHRTLRKMVSYRMKS